MMTKPCATIMAQVVNKTEIWWIQVWLIPRCHNHARQKRRCANDPCLFEIYLFWIEKVNLWCLLKHKMKAKRSNQSKVPSINKHCFLFPLSSFFATAELYLLRFLFSIAKQKALRGSIAFACCGCGVSFESSWRAHFLGSAKTHAYWVWHSL